MIYNLGICSVGTLKSKITFPVYPTILTTVSSVLRFMDSDSSFGIFKLFLPKLELKYCSLNFNSAENVTNIQFKIISVKQTDNGQIVDDGRQVIAKADIILRASQVSKKKTLYFVKL